MSLTKEGENTRLPRLEEKETGANDCSYRNVLLQEVEPPLSPNQRGKYVWRRD